MTADGTLKRVLNEQQRTKPSRAQSITYAKGEQERRDYGKLKPDDLRPLIERDIENYLNAGGLVDLIPPGKTGIVEC